MHEIYAALAIASLQKQFGDHGRLSEDEFYARYSEAPWLRLSRFSRTLLGRTGLRTPTASTVTADQHACRLAKA